MCGTGVSPETIQISKLLPTVDSPRMNGEDAEHVKTLASSGAVLPPILVHRQSLRVIDGAHRLKAAILRGAEQIEVTYFDGDHADAFVAAVEANTTHGLPLSLADRRAAAVRILIEHPGWSDRVIAKVTGLAATTVAAIRRPTGDVEQLDGRRGKDGRVRPVDATIGRLRAAAVLRDRPQAPLREVASAAGVSPMTARDVRERLERGEPPTIPKRSRYEGAATTPPGRAGKRKPEPAVDPMTIVQNLSRDPTLRQAETGRTLLRGLGMQAHGLAGYPRTATQVPPHCLYALVDLAYAFAGRWRSVAEELERHLGEVTDQEGSK
jgi:ParB-like chromosome segregation protein Spo0J